MASEALEMVRSKALGLSEADRAELAHDLLASLDGAPEQDVADAWDREILRRLQEVEDGSVDFLDRAEFQRRMRLQVPRA